MAKLESDCMGCAFEHSYRMIGDEGEPMYSITFCILDMPHKEMFGIVKDCTQRIDKEDYDNDDNETTNGLN